MEPSGELPGLLNAAKSVGGPDIFAMGAPVAEAPQEVQLVEHQGLGNGLETGVVQQVHEVGLRYPFELQLDVQAIDQALSKIAQLDQGAFRIGVGVVLRIAPHIGKLRIRGPQGLEVQRLNVLHRHLVGFRGVHACSFAKAVPASLLVLILCFETQAVHPIAQRLMVREAQHFGRGGLAIARLLECLRDVVL